MSEPVRLFRLRREADAAKPWLEVHSFLKLAETRSDLFTLAGDAPPEPPAGRVALVSIFSEATHTQLEWALGDPQVRTWMGAGVPLLLDDCQEGGPPGLRGWETMRKVVDSATAPHGRIVFLMQNEAAPGFCLKAFAGAPIEITPIVVHYWLHRFRASLDVSPRIDRRELRARFLCFNHKIRPHRAAVVGHLARRGMLECGLVSAGRADPSSSTLDSPSYDAFEREAIETFPTMEDDILAARPIFAQGRHLGEWPLVENPQSVLHAETGFSLVTETELSGGEVLRFTEKTLKPLAAGHPIVHFGNPNVLALLRRYGFETFEPEIDESYDEEIEPEHRLRLALGVARHLISMRNADFDALLNALEPRIAHNAKHVIDGLPAIMERQMSAVYHALTRSS